MILPEWLGPQHAYSFGHCQEWISLSHVTPFPARQAVTVEVEGLPRVTSQSPKEMEGTRGTHSCCVRIPESCLEVAVGLCAIPLHPCQLAHAEHPDNRHQAGAQPF